jgi:hypothetical protein
MGMFDYVVCDVKLPDGLDHTKHTFQTKSIQNESCLDTFLIDTEGRLHRKSYPNQFKFFDYTGTFNFYKSVGGVWHEYQASFYNGYLYRLVVDEERVNFFNKRRKKRRTP